MAPMFYFFFFFFNKSDVSFVLCFHGWIIKSSFLEQMLTTTPVGPLNELICVRLKMAASPFHLFHRDTNMVSSSLCVLIRNQNHMFASQEVNERLHQQL